MNIIDQLASSLGHRDEVPNIALAQKIAKAKDKKAVKELFENLSNKSKDVQSDCIKVLYEIGTLTPSLISPFTKELVTLLDSKNNRIQWGAMTALNSIVQEVPDQIFSALGKIIATADKGSVITNDHCVGILITLCGIKKSEAAAFALLNERLLKSPVNQLPTYAEQALPVIGSNRKAAFVKTLSARLNDIEKESKRKRVEKAIKKAQN